MRAALSKCSWRSHPGHTAAVNLTMAEQELTEPVPTAGAVDDQVRSAAGQVPDHLFPRRRNVYRGQLAGTVEMDEAPDVSVLILAPGVTGISEGAITSVATPRRMSNRARS